MQQVLSRASFNGRYGVRPCLGDATSDYQQSLAQTQHSIQVAGSMGAGVATAAVGAIASHLAATGGSLIGLSSATLSAAVPFIGPALMGATMLVQYLIANSGCGITCVETSEWANQAAEALQKVLDGYFALPAPRTDTQKALALAAFKDIWGQLQAACGQPGTGDAGKRCISDRQAGACTWKQKYAPVYPGEPEIGACWNWFNGYRDPIANDPTVPDPAPQSTADSSLQPSGDLISQSLQSVSSAFGGVSPLLLIGGALILAAALGGSRS